MKTKRRPTVTIQAEIRVPRVFYRNGEKRLTKHKERQWVSVCRAPVLFHDNRDILVRQFGATSLYRASGSSNMVGYRLKHPTARKLPHHPYGWRIHPDSVKRLREVG